MSKPVDRLPPLDLLAAFEAAARHLSFTRAAAERFITQSAMSRQIQALEEDLGVALFRRKHRALALTDEGRKLLAVCDTVLSQLRQTVAELRSPARREVLSLTTTPGLAALWLVPRLSAFTQSNPGIDVRLDASFETRNLAADGFDVAIRYAPEHSDSGHRLFRETILPVCAPSLRRRLRLDTPADLRHHTLLQLVPAVGTGMPLEWESWLQAAGLAGLQPAATLSFSGYGETIAAAVAGQGVALGRRPLVDALLRSRKLVAPFKDATASPRAFFLLVNKASQHRPAVHALQAWLVDQALQS